MEGKRAAKGSLASEVHTSSVCDPFHSLRKTIAPLAPTNGRSSIARRGEAVLHIAGLITCSSVHTAVARILIKFHFRQWPPIPFLDHMMETWNTQRRHRGVRRFVHDGILIVDRWLLLVLHVRGLQ